MAKATLKINGEEIAIGDDLVTIGRAADNKLPLAGDSNVSRYHAEIEQRGGEFWLIELGSSNGTTLNGAPVTGEILLQDGDLITLGGTSEIEFFTGAAAPEKEEEKAAAPPPVSLPTGAPNLSAGAAAPAAAVPPVSVDAAAASGGKMSPMLIVMGLVCGLAVISVAAVVIYSYSSGGGGGTGSGGFNIFGSAKCEARAVITKPENGDIISKETEIAVDAQNTECVRRAVFLIGDAEIASSETAPYSFTLDPKRFPALADGTNHSLKLILEDTSGNLIPSSEVILAFETAAIETPTPTPGGEDTPEPTDTPLPAQPGKQPSLIEIQEMSRRLLKQFSGSFAYKFEPQFLQEVQKRTADYAAAEGYSTRAETYRDLINEEFRKGEGLDAPLGFLLAMSRSKFNPEKQGADEGLWQLSEELVAPYKTPCLSESLSDKSQACAAKTAAIYTKALVLKLFNGDVVYGVSAFGMSEQEASTWASSLPPNRENFWRVITNQKQREQVVRFFAAAIVAENPPRFGMKKDKPISGLYRNLIGN